MLITDIDIVKIEPEVYSLPVYEGQKRCGGTNGIVAGTQFTAAGVDFSALQVGPGSMLFLNSADDSIKGVFEIVGLIDAGHLTVSQLRNSPEDAAIPIGAASGLTWSIKTLAPQIQQVELHLSARLGLQPGTPEAAYGLDAVEPAEVLKQVATALLLVQVYTTLYTGTLEASIRNGYEKKRGWYLLQAERLLAVVSVQLPAA